MKRLFLPALLAGAAIMTGPSPVLAQTFLTYNCGDGSQFVVAFFKGDRTAHVQLDGKALTLKRRPSVTGTRYGTGTLAVLFTRSTTRLVRGLRSTECRTG